MKFKRKGEDDEKIKKILSTIILTSIFVLTYMVNDVKASNFEQVPSDENDAIVEIIEGFFVESEYRVDNQIYEPILFDKYFIEAHSANTEVNIATIDAILYQRMMVAKHHPSELKELNKKLEFEFSEFVLEENTAQVDVIVTKTFNYNFSEDIESCMVDTYSIALVYNEDGWRITEIDGYIDEITMQQFETQGVDVCSVASIVNYKADIEKQVVEYFEATQNEVPISARERVSTRAISYNGNAASTYALNYALNYNPSYYDFNGLGGDCTNFISQCLFEGGGLPMKTGENYATEGCWFYSSGSVYSSTWTKAKYFHDYVLSGNSVIKASLSNWSSVGFGDIIQLMSGGEAYHSMIVTGIAQSSYGRSDLLICSHTKNRRHVSLAATYGTGYTKEYIDITGSTL